MNCPACSSKLTPQNAGNLELDVCTESCGGIWFDAGELEKLDHADENAADSLLRPLTNQKVPLDRARGRQCPKCPGTSLARQFYDSQYEIEIDYCLRCGGIWLDLGELETLRQHNKDKSAQQAIIDGFLAAAQRSGAGAGAERLRAVLRLLF